MAFTPEQWALRTELLRFRISASEIAGLLLHPVTGDPMHPYESPMRIFAKRTGAYEEQDAVHQRWGARLEPIILADYAESKNYKLSRTGVDARTLVCDRYPFLAATPDAIAEMPSGHRLVPDAKNVTGPDVYEWGCEGTDSGPDYYRAQVMVGAGIASDLGLSDFEGDLVAQLGGRAPSIFPVDCDRDTLGALNDLAEKFVKDHIIPGRKPEGWERDRHASEWVKARWAAHDAQMKPHSDTAKKAARQLTIAQTRISKWERAEEAAKARICDEIGGALGIAGIATWKANKNGVRTLRLVK